MSTVGGTAKARTLAIRAPNWVGDLVMSTPVLEAALADPRWSRVQVFVRQHLALVLADGPCAPHVVTFANAAEETAAYLHNAPDAALLLSNSLGAAWRAFCARVPLRAGTGLLGRRWLLTHAMIPPTCDGRRLPVPSAQLMRDAAGLFGIVTPDLHPRLYARDAVIAAQRALLGRLGVDVDAGYVSCCPGAAFGAAKLWPVEHYARALDMLHARYGWRAVLSGAPNESALIDAVARACKHPAVSLAREARDLETLKAIVRASKLLVVGDSGPRWYAAAFDVPCVSILGPNFPEVTATSLELAAIVRVEGLECSPCLRKVCPLEHHRCMRDLTPERVVEAADEVLARAQVRAASESSPSIALAAT